MAGVTLYGWEPKTYDDIFNSLSERVKEAYGEDTPTTPDSAFGQFNNIYVASIKDLWDLGGQIEDTQNRSTAEGLYLDYLASLVGLARQQARGAEGDLLFQGDVGTLIAVNTVCKDLEDRNVLTQQAGELNRSSCYTSSFIINDFQDNTDYTINVEGYDATANSAVGNDELYVLSVLKASIDANTDMDTLLDVDNTTLVVTYPSDNNELTTTNSSNMTITSVGVYVNSVSALEGDVTFLKDTITTLVTPTLGVVSVNNPDDFTEGRFLETDQELRIRMEAREQSTGTATKPAIEASLSEIAGVTSVLVLVNDTLIDDPATGVPAKSFESFVTGGDEDAIASVIWRTKPIIGQTHGEITKTIIDTNGDTQGVKFSRPTTKYAWVRVSYEITDENIFPSDGETQMQNVVLAYGESLTQGEDLVASKFYCPLYTIRGIYVKSVEVAVTGTVYDPPLYVDTYVPVNDTVALDFSTNRITIGT